MEELKNWIKQDMEYLSNAQLGKMYKYVRSCIAQVPERALYCNICGGEINNKEYK